MPKKRKYLVICLTLILSMLFTPTVFAGEKPVKVFLNGSEIKYDVPPRIISGRTMVPIHETIEAIAGSNIEWDDAAKTVTFAANGRTNKHTVGETVVYIDGAAHEFDTPSRVIDSHTLAPVRMIAETSGYQVDWDAEHYCVNITQKPVPEEEGIRLEYDRLNVTGIELEDAPGEPNYIGYYFGPYIFGLGSEGFETYVHKYLSDAVTKPVREFEKGYNEFRAEIVAEKDPEMKENLQMIAGRYDYAAETHIVTTAEDYCAVAEVRYEYTGGAHPVTFVRVFNIDIPGEKFMTLSDIFRGGSYKAVIEKKLGEMAKTDAYKELLYDPAPEVKIVDENDFYLTDGKLVIFYQQYEIAPYAAGFITFEIPLLEIGDILKDEYRIAAYEKKLSRDQLFEMIFDQNDF